ncbi:MAG: PASTA domain-containing protein [Ilumatobacter sp.]|uniref:PASTA domain-containing protein n=1 Tax=Ilumatobacter sp. TaxID=1967498 RepID=UPI001D21D9E2|nr:PASTA domain-containing protein [Ilumatobacter sp.]MBT5276610.1 PASTA domain-containing protein [Ilumatobacter sp.]MBT5865176.1 PASTA domain-containing protein [Ilumatobacter sp.]
MAVGKTFGNDSVDDLVDRVLVDRYRVVEVVSAGANTVICSAFDIETDQPVTFKIVQPDLAEDEAFRREFRTRAEVAAALGHPNIAAVLNWGDIELDGASTVFWVVEHLGGGSLRDLFDRGRLLEPSQALVVGLEACRALAAAHERGIAHTELTPSKLVFGTDRRLRIVDFGMAELIGREAWTEPATVATHVARYASPEQALGLDVGPKTDVYALALCLLEAVTGTVPFASDSTVSTLAARVGKLMPVSADIGSLASVIERAGRPEAEDRFTAGEYGRALVQAAEKLPRPEPIPIVAAALLEPVDMRRPSDPTGGVERPVDSIAEPEIVASTTAPESDLDAPVVVAAAAGIAAAGAADAPIPAGDGDGLVILSDVSDAEVTDVAETDVAAVPTTVVDEVVPDSAPATEQMPVTAMPLASAPSELYDDERPRRRTGAMVMLALFVIAGVAAIAFAAFYLLRTKSYEVPELAGVEEAVALNEIAGNDWVIGVEYERSDDEPDVGEVIRTFPLPGAVLEEGADFTLFVSDGPLFRVLPEVAGLTAEAAAATLADLQLQSIVDAEGFDEVAESGVVLSWRVIGAEASVAGGEVLPGTNLALTVSKGPAPRVVIDVTGLTLEEAQAVAGQVQLNVVAGEDAFSDDVPAGIIFRQDTAVGVELPRDGTITVIRSKGPDLIALPALEGLSYTAAQQVLTDAGFTIGSLLGTTEGTFLSISISADPIGDLYRRGTSVDLIFL